MLGNNEAALAAGEASLRLAERNELKEANEKHKIVEYLKQHGAVRPAEEAAWKPETTSDQVVDYFSRNLGPVKPQSMQEIVPTGLPIAIHAIPPSEGRDHLTLFTTGMSEQPLDVPDGGEAFRYAELMIELPGAWTLDKELLAEEVFRWPFDWLRTLARVPHDHETWLGPATIIAGSEPPEPIAPNSPFTSMLLLAESEAKLTDRTVQIYRMFPLYPEERQLEIDQGIPALLQAFDKKGIAMIYAHDRPNAAI